MPRKRVAAVLVLFGAAAALFLGVQLGRGGAQAGTRPPDCVSAFEQPAAPGTDPTCRPNVSFRGLMLWNFEGLLYRTFPGGLVAIKTTNPKSPNFVSGYQVCPSCRFFSFSFNEHTTSAFKLVAEGPKTAPDTTKERLVRIEGRYVLCDPSRKWFLVWYPHTLNFGLDCSPA